MLIVDIDHHEVILNKLWMNKNEILLNMQNDVIVFLDQLNTSISIFSISLNSKHSSWSRSSSLSSIIQTKTFMMLKRLVSITAQKESFLIRSINAARLIALSWVEIFLKKCQVELRSWIQALKSSWEAWLDNSIWKLNSTQQDIR